MGTWGPGIFSEDVACDVRNEYRGLLQEGMEDDAATDLVIERWKSTQEDPDEGPTFWIALAMSQSKLGRLRQDVKDRALDAIAAGPDARWQEAGLSGKRAAALTKAEKVLSGPQPERRTVRAPSKRRFIDGEPIQGLVLAIPLGDGTQAYGRVIPPGMEFYGKRDPEGTEPDLEAITSEPRAWWHGVSYRAIRSRRWEVAGIVPLTKKEQEEQFPMWRLDGVTGFAYLYEYNPSTVTLGSTRLSRKECEQMVLASVMDDVHVEEKLRDHFAGRQYLGDMHALDRIVDP